MASQKVANNPLGSYPVLVDRNTAGSDIQVVRLDIGTGTAESRVTSANPLPTTLSGTGGSALTSEPIGTARTGLDVLATVAYADTGNSYSTGVGSTTTVIVTSSSYGSSLRVGDLIYWPTAIPTDYQEISIVKALLTSTTFQLQSALPSAPGNGYTFYTKRASYLSSFVGSNGESKLTVSDTGYVPYLSNISDGVSVDTNVSFTNVVHTGVWSNGVSDWTAWDGYVSLSSPLPSGTNTIGTVQTYTANTSILDGSKTVTTAGTRVTLAASTACKHVDIQALATNTDVIVVGGTTVVAASGSRRGVALNPGDVYSVDIDNLNDVNLDSVVSGEGVSFVYYT